MKQRTTVNTATESRAEVHMVVVGSTNVIPIHMHEIQAPIPHNLDIDLYHSLSGIVIDPLPFHSTLAQRTINSKQSSFKRLPVS